ncbi:MAG TPA: hypothetical protein VNN73_02460 [Blastocatellia bacterium]|nr:hypothetical protein [Blastocatellia bacterium]
MSDEQSQKVIETSELRLVDNNGQVRAKLMIDDGEPKLILLDKANRKRLGVGMLSTGEVGISLYDESERLHIALIVTAAGTPEISVITREGREYDLVPRKQESIAKDLEPLIEAGKKSRRWLLKK